MKFKDSTAKKQVHFWHGWLGRVGHVICKENSVSIIRRRPGPERTLVMTRYLGPLARFKVSLENVDVICCAPACL